MKMPDYCEPPGRLQTIRELAAPLEWLSFVPNTLGLRAAPRGDGRTVLLVPGYLAGHLSMSPLKSFLRSLRYKVDHWGFGTNMGNVDDDVRAFGGRVKTLALKTGAPVTLIGWSLGGVISREVARLFQPHVREIVTMGTPVIGGPKYTVAGPAYATQHNLDLDDFEKEVHRRNLIGLEQPITAFYSKSDGVVGWQSAVDIYNAQARNIEVKSSHLGLGVNPKVWRLIAETLALNSVSSARETKFAKSS